MILLGDFGTWKSWRGLGVQVCGSRAPAVQLVATMAALSMARHTTAPKVDRCISPHRRCRTSLLRRKQYRAMEMRVPLNITTLRNTNSRNNQHSRNSKTFPCRRLDMLRHSNTLSMTLRFRCTSRLLTQTRIRNLVLGADMVDRPCLTRWTRRMLYRQALPLELPLDFETSR